jgi:hypothetical protein
MGYSSNAMLGAMYAGGGFNSDGLAAQHGLMQPPPDPFAYLNDAKPYAAQPLSVPPQIPPCGLPAPSQTETLLLRHLIMRRRRHLSILRSPQMGCPAAPLTQPVPCIISL